MQAVAERVLDGELDPASAVTSRPSRHARAESDRRCKLMLIDGNSLTYRAFFALPDRPRHRHRPGHQRRVRVHVDAHQPGARPPARRGSPSRSTGPSRRSATSRSTTTRPTGTRRPTSCASRWGSCARSSRRCGIPILEQAGLRGRRHHRHAGHPGPRPRRRRAHRHRRPRQLPARRGPARQGALQPARRVRLRALRRGRHRGAHRRHAREYVAVRRAARRPVRQPARRPRASARRPRPSSSTRTAASTASSTTSTSRRPSCARTWPSTRRRRGSNAEVMVLLRDVAARRRPRRPRARPSSTPTRCDACSTSSSSARSRPPGRGARRRRSAPPPSEADVLEAEVDRARRRRPTRSRCSTRWPRPTGAARRRRRRGTGPRAARPLDGLALVVDAGDGARWRGSRPTLLDDAGGARRAPARCSATAADRSPRTTPRRSMRALLGHRHRRAHARARHRARRLPARPGRVPLRARATCSLRYADLELPAATAPRPRASSTSAATAATPRSSAARAALAVDRLVEPLLAALDAQGLRALHDDIEVPLVRVLARMEDVGVGVDARRAASA